MAAPHTSRRTRPSPASTTAAAPLEFWFYYMYECGCQRPSVEICPLFRRPILSATWQICTCWSGGGCNNKEHLCRWCSHNNYSGAMCEVPPSLWRHLTHQRSHNKTKIPGGRQLWRRRDLIGLLNITLII
jgi:hypothetical protein